jgi:rfaE bifunctional protein nucleotidyltransferase chain/domain
MKSSKILDKEQFDQVFTSLKAQGKSVVFTNGCFDILHPGHVAYLEEAKKLGDLLVVGINSDVSVKRLKGDSRPINDFYFRSHMLAGLESVNFVLEFTEDTPLNLITKVIPSVLVKGADYNITDIVGADFTVSNGGIVQTIAFLKGFSSSSIISKIQGLT